MDPKFYVAIGWFLFLASFISLPIIMFALAVDKQNKRFIKRITK